MLYFVGQYSNETAKIYMSSGGIAGYASELLSYAQTNTDGFTISGLEVGLDSIVIRCNTSNADSIEPFLLVVKHNQVDIRRTFE